LSEEVKYNGSQIETILHTVLKFERDRAYFQRVTTFDVGVSDNMPSAPPTSQAQNNRYCNIIACKSVLMRPEV